MVILLKWHIQTTIFTKRSELCLATETQTCFIGNKHDQHAITITKKGYAGIIIRKKN